MFYPFQENPLGSVFERNVYVAFHDSPKPTQAVQQLHAAQNNAIEIDAVRCRRNALDQNQSPLPIFSPVDQIQVLDDCALGDYNWVNKDLCIDDPIRYARLLPYSGQVVLERICSIRARPRHRQVVRHHV